MFQKPGRNSVSCSPVLPLGLACSWLQAGAQQYLRLQWAQEKRHAHLDTSRATWSCLQFTKCEEQPDMAKPDFCIFEILYNFVRLGVLHFLSNIVY